MIDLFAILLYY